MKTKRFIASFICVVFVLLFINSVSMCQNYKNSLKPGAKELIDKRTEYSKTFLNADSSYTTIIFTYKIHFRNAKGIFEDIEASDNQTEIDGTSNVAFYKPYYHTAGWENNNNSTQFGYDNWDNQDKQKRSYVWWNTSIIPSSATVTSTSIYMQRTGGGGNNYVTTFKIRKMVTNWGPNPSQNDAFTIWNECLSGTIYLSTNSSATSFYFVSNDQENPSFKNDLQTRLAQGWMEMGVTNDNESTSDGDYYKAYIAHYLTVDWTAPAQLYVDPLNWIVPSPYPGNQKIINVSNSGGGGSFYFDVTNNNSEWITLQSGYNHYTPSSFTLFFSANYTCYQRIGTVTVIANGIQGSPKTVTITQSAASTITLPDQQVQNLEQYSATDWIHVNNFEVSPTGYVQNLTLIATNNITLNPGFLATSDGNCSFHAIIQQCGPIVDSSITSKYVNLLVKENVLQKNDIFEKHENIDFPNVYSLSQNYPNPFNPTTSIKYALKEDCKVSLKIYNILGKEVVTLVNEFQQAGYKTVYWNGLDSYGMDLPSGVYFYKLVAGSFVKASKMVLLK